jgi:tetratricopeptide (TPR) repeat protein
MQTTDTITKLKVIHAHIEQRQLKLAIEGVRVLASLSQQWAITEKISELETNYQYMLHYLIEGKKDPEQQHIYEKLIRDLYTIADDAAEYLLLQESSALFFEKSRQQQVRLPLSMDEYRSIITRQADTFSFISLLEEGEEKERRLKENELTHENTLQDLFYTIFVSPRANADMIASYRSFMDDELIPVYDKSVFLSALTMNLLQRFDAAKVELLLDICGLPDSELATRAIIGIIPIFQTYTARWTLYPECGNRLKLLSDDKLFNRRFVAAIIGFIQAHETEKITKRLTEEILPEMMKLSPMIGKKINLDEWMGESGLDEKNPEWQKILDESGLTDKLQEFSELQLEGADVFHSTFSNLKSYPFFQEMSNWFLPFNPQHSSIRQLFSDKSEGASLIETMLRSSLICNSDKYSFCFSVMMMPENYRHMMISQLGAEGEELTKMQAEEEVLKPYQKEDTLIKQYIQDLYRFFKLYKRSTGFGDIFSLPLNYHLIETFHPVVQQPRHLEQIALYYFEKNNFSEALTAYMMLAETGVTKSEVWQKIGYCRQMLADINGALEAYLHADLIDENNTWVIHRIAHCYRMLKQPGTALTYYRRLEQFRPDDLQIQLNIGHCFLELKQYDTALNFYFKVELLDSRNRRAWRSVAWCAFLSRKFDVARKYYAMILENEPNAHDYLNAGHVELCLEENKKAVQFYQTSMEKAGSFDAFRSMLTEDEDELQEAGVNTALLPIILDKIRYGVNDVMM